MWPEKLNGREIMTKVIGDLVSTPENTSQFTRETNYGTWRFQKGWKPLHVVDAEGCWFTDDAGKRYLDMSSQLMCVNLGHKNPRVIESIAEQARELPFMGPAYATNARARLSAKLLEVLPAGLEKFFFTTSGTDANEAAFKIARMVTGKNKIISRYRSYHGSTAGSLAATGDPRRWAMEPAGKCPASSRLKSTATTAPSSTLIRHAISPVPTTSST